MPDAATHLRPPTWCVDAMLVKRWASDAVDDTSACSRCWSSSHSLSCTHAPSPYVSARPSMGSGSRLPGRSKHATHAHPTALALALGAVPAPRRREMQRPPSSLPSRGPLPSRCSPALPCPNIGRSFSASVRLQASAPLACLHVVPAFRAAPLVICCTRASRCLGHCRCCRGARSIFCCSPFFFLLACPRRHAWVPLFHLSIVRSLTRLSSSQLAYLCLILSCLIRPITSIRCDLLLRFAPPRLNLSHDCPGRSFQPCTYARKASCLSRDLAWNLAITTSVSLGWCRVLSLPLWRLLRTLHRCDLEIPHARRSIRTRVQLGSCGGATACMTCLSFWTCPAEAAPARLLRRAWNMLN